MNEFSNAETKPIKPKRVMREDIDQLEHAIAELGAKVDTLTMQVDILAGQLPDLWSLVRSIHRKF